MMEFYETYENLRLTAWSLVIELLRGEIRPRDEVYYPIGKINYFNISSLLGECDLLIYSHSIMSSTRFDGVHET